MPLFKRQTGRMGYEVHITRRRDWADSDHSRDISFKEFEDLVAQDPQLGYRDDSYSTLKDGSRRYPAFLIGNIESAVGLIVQPDANGMVPTNWNWLRWNTGNLQSKYPTPNMIRKMIEIAVQLGAQVQGDDSEIYFINDKGELANRQPDYESWADA